MKHMLPYTLLMLTLTGGVLEAKETIADRKPAEVQVKNAIELLKMGESLKVPKQYRSGPMAGTDPYLGIRAQAASFEIALQGDIPSAIKACERIQHPHRDYRRMTLVFYRYHGIKAALEFVHQINPTKAESHIAIQLDVLYSLYYFACADKNTEAMTRIVSDAISLSRPPEQARQPKTAATSRDVVTRFIQIQLEHGEYVAARATAEMQTDLDKKKILIAQIDSAESKRTSNTRRPIPTNNTQNKTIDAARQELRKRHPELERLIDLGDGKKVIAHINSFSDTEARVIAFRLCAAILLDKEDSTTAAVSIRLMLENAALLISPTDVSRAMLELVPLIQSKADSELLAKSYATAGRLTWIVPQNYQHVDSAAGGIAESQSRNGDLQGAVNWLYRAPKPHLVEVVYIRLAAQMLNDVAYGQVNASASPLKPVEGPLLTLADDDSFQGKKLKYWIGQLNPKIKASEPEQRDAATALAGIGRAALPALIEYHRTYSATNLKGEHRYVGAAGHAMHRIGAEAVPPLIELFVTQKDNEAADTAETLRIIGAPAITPLCALLTNPDRNVRLRTCRALRQMSIHAGEAIDALTQTASADSDAAVRKEATNALAAINAYR